MIVYMENYYDVSIANIIIIFLIDYCSGSYTNIKLIFTYRCIYANIKVIFLQIIIHKFMLTSN